MVADLAAGAADQDGAPLVRDARYAVFQFAEAALPRAVFVGMLDLIHGLRPPPPG